MNLEIENLSRKHGLMLITEDQDYLHCCQKCEVATSLGSVEVCPQRVHTSNSCCPSCGIFLEHGLEAMLSHWKDQGQFMVGFQIVMPLKITEDVIRSAFGLQKVPINQLRLLYEWNNSKTLDIVFEKHIDWVMTIRQNYWPLDFLTNFLLQPLIYGLSGFPDRAGASVFSQLRNLFEDFKNWVQNNFQIDPIELFRDEIRNNSESLISYYVSYFIRIENAENLIIDILAPDYEKSSEPEICLAQVGTTSQIPILSFQKVNEALVRQKGLLSAWYSIEPALEKMLDELSEITGEIRALSELTIAQLSQLLDCTQIIQARFLKMKPSISNMQGHIAPMVPLLESEVLIQKLLSNFNLSLVSSWLDFARSVERSVEGTNSYIRGKMNLLTLAQEKKTTKRLNLLTALFGSLSGLNLIITFLAWGTPSPSQDILVIVAIFLVSLIALTLLVVTRIISRD